MGRFKERFRTEDLVGPGAVDWIELVWEHARVVLLVWIVAVGLRMWRQEAA